MSRLPIVEARRRKAIRKRLARRLDEIEIPDPSIAGRVSKTRARKLEREENRIRERDRKKAEHKLRFLDRVFGLGRGPAGLRMKWLDILFERVGR